MGGNRFDRVAPRNLPDGVSGGYVEHRDGRREGEWWVERKWGEERWVGWADENGLWTFAVQPTLPI